MSWLRSLSARLRHRTTSDSDDRGRNATSDPNRNPDWIIIPGPDFREEEDEPPSQEQILRKQRSEARLRELGLPTYPWMPPLIGEKSVRLRDIGEVIERGFALSHCGWKARVLYQGGSPELEQAECDALLRDENATAFTERERRFLADPYPDKLELVQYIWRFDGLCVLLWAMRAWEEPLGPPYAPPGTAVGDAEVLRIFQRPPKAEPALRPLGEVLDLYDLTARCFWPCNYFHFHGKPQPPGFNRDVLIEHHHALEWLIGIREWDEWMDGNDEDDVPNRP